MFTDAEVMLADCHRRDMNRTVNDAQGLINGKNSELKAAYAEIVMLRAALSTARDQLRTEQTARLKAEAELDHVLTLVDDMK